MNSKKVSGCAYTKQHLFVYKSHILKMAQVEPLYAVALSFVSTKM